MHVLRSINLKHKAKASKIFKELTVASALEDSQKASGREGNSSMMDNTRYVL